VAEIGIKTWGFNLINFDLIGGFLGSPFSIISESFGVIFSGDLVGIIAGFYHQQGILRII